METWTDKDEESATMDRDGNADTTQIQRRAYEIYQARGETPGQDLEDWFQAESELRGRSAERPAGKWPAAERPSAPRRSPPQARPALSDSDEMDGGAANGAPATPRMRRVVNATD